MKTAYCDTQKFQCDQCISVLQNDSSHQRIVIYNVCVATNSYDCPSKKKNCEVILPAGLN